MHNLEHEDRCLLYESGELSPAERKAFEAESEHCPACRLFLEAARRNSQIARAAACLPPEELNNSILREIRRNGETAPTAPPNRRVLTFAFAAALVVLIVAGRSRQQKSLQWTNGIEQDFVFMSEDIESLSLGMASRSSESAGVEFETEMRDLEAEVEQLGGGI